MSKQPHIENGLSREDWLAWHRDRTKLTASMVGTIIGRNPYESAYTLWARLLGRVPWGETSLPADIGHALEPVITEHYTRETGRVLVDPGDYVMYQHPDYPWLWCTLDRIIIGAQWPLLGDMDPTGGVAELKTTGMLTGDAYEYRQGTVPDHVQAQVQLQMDISGLPYGAIVGLIGNNKLLYFDVKHSGRLSNLLITRCQEFLWYLGTETPPPIDCSESTSETIAFLHPRDTGRVVRMPVVENMEVIRLETAAAIIEHEEEVKKEAENRIKAAIGDASYAVLADGRVYSWKWQKRKGGIKVDIEHEAKIQEAGIPYRKTDDSEFRVMRKHEKLPKGVTLEEDDNGGSDESGITGGHGSRNAGPNAGTDGVCVAEALQCQENGSGVSDGVPTDPEAL